MATCRGSTSCIFSVRPGVVVKQPADVWEESSAYSRLTKKIANNFLVERRIMEALGAHPRIVKYHGWQDKTENLHGLLFSKASHGNLQNYLETSHDIIPSSVRQKWCRQAVEPIPYIHSQDIIHSDIRPENYLVHATTPMSLDLWLCDFGGSFCEKLGVNGKQLPDPGFFDPNAKWMATKTNDIFSVGSVLYSIVTGHWPYRDPGPFKSAEESRNYDERVEEHFRNREYPDINGLFGGAIILGCWTGKYMSADDVLQALDQEIELTGESGV
ncbi:MAG: hypothetical protein M1821_007783 [Bathelium mastoideum]|nr:MAG: hypothetical protein M1821_007783 [Bathelium mastoideum]